jgi:hypothetical protein
MRFIMPILIVCISLFSCQKIEVPVVFNSLYPDTIDGISYADSVVYFVDKADGEDFEINLKFSGGSGFKEMKIFNYGRNEITTRTDVQEVTESFSLQLPDLNSTSGLINVKGMMDHNKFYRGITATDKDNYNISFYVFDKLGIYKTVVIKFRKP